MRGEQAQTWIAKRTVQVLWPDGRESEVVVEIGAPFSDDRDEELWFCAYRISGKEPAEYQEAFGPGDSLSALTSAVVMAGLRLKLLEERGATVTWLGDLDLGFPPPIQVAPTAWTRQRGRHLPLAWRSAFGTEDENKEGDEPSAAEAKAIDPASELERIEGMLADGSLADRVGGVMRLRAIGATVDDATVRAFAERAITDPDWIVREEAVRVLIEMARPATFPLLTARLPMETNETVLCSLADAAGYLGIREALPALLELISLRSAPVRSWATESIGRLGGENEWVVLARRLADAKDDADWPALQAALVRLGDGEAFHALTHADGSWSFDRGEISIRELEHLLWLPVPDLVTFDEVMRGLDAIAEHLPGLVHDVRATKAWLGRLGD